MRPLRLFMLNLAMGVLVAQGPIQSDADRLADEHDHTILLDTFYVTISVEDIYRSPEVRELAERQADQMVKAAQSRVARWEKQIEMTRAAVEAGQLPREALTDVFAEMHKRSDLTYLAIDRATIVRDILRAARAEEQRRLRARAPVLRHAGKGRVTPFDFQVLSKAFFRQFRRPLPVSADGDTALHRALGFDHTGRVDVALAPDQPEGLWMRKYLETMRIPYYAFRKAIAGSATAPHFHIGPPSFRYSPASELSSPARRSRSGSSVLAKPAR